MKREASPANRAANRALVQVVDDIRNGDMEAAAAAIEAAITSVTDEARAMSRAHREHAQTAIEHGAATNHLLALTEERTLRAEEQIARAREVLKPFAKLDPGPDPEYPRTTFLIMPWEVRDVVSLLAHLNEQEKDDG